MPSTMDRIKERLENDDAAVGDFMAGPGGIAATVIVVITALYVLYAFFSSLF